MSDPWVLLTGPKGATGPQLPVPTAPVRRWCGPYTTTTPMAYCGFTYGFNFANYSPVTGAGHCQLQAYRNAQGRCTYNGLVNITSGADSTNVFTLPWDMLPAPMGEVRCCIANVNNQRARFDVLWDGVYGWHYQRVGSAVAITGGVFIGVQHSWQTFVPTCWVDSGMKVSARQAPVLPGQDVAIEYTVGPGQISGNPGGEPFTQVFPAVTTVKIPYTRTPSVTVMVLFYYDVATQQFNNRLIPTSLSAPTPEQDPSVWMRMAEQGQVVLASHQLDYSTGNYDNYWLMDHRFLMRGPLDTTSAVP